MTQQCTHVRQQLRKSKGFLNTAVLYCLDCNWQKKLTFEEAYQLIVAKAAQAPSD
jgi:hypothetical protein